MLIYYCVEHPIQETAGGVLFSRYKSDEGLSKKSIAELRRVAKKFDLDFDDMCASNNEWCPNE